MNILQTRIQGISKEMKHQDNLCSQNPLWVIQEDIKEYVHYDWDWDYKERIQDYDYNDLCSKCQSLLDRDEDTELLEDCDCDTDLFHYYRKKEELNLKAGVFFTRLACQNHINMNSYHYHNPRPYAISVWRNSEMVAVINYILNSEKTIKPNFYDKYE